MAAQSNEGWVNPFAGKEIHDRPAAAKAEPDFKGSVGPQPEEPTGTQVLNMVDFEQGLSQELLDQLFGDSKQEPAEKVQPLAQPLEETREVRSEAFESSVSDTALIAEIEKIVGAAPRVDFATQAAPETAPIAETAPVAETAPIAETSLIFEMAPVAGTAPIAEMAPVAETAPIAEMAPVAETAPIAETVLVAETAPAPAPAEDPGTTLITQVEQVAFIEAAPFYASPSAPKEEGDRGTRALSQEEDAAAAKPVHSIPRSAETPIAAVVPEQPKVRYWITHLRSKTKREISCDGYVIGKSKYSSFQIRGTNTVSRSHAIFHLDEEGCWIEDDESRNGTYVNDQLIQSHSLRLLEDGDEIRLSDEDFVFRVER